MEVKVSRYRFDSMLRSFRSVAFLRSTSIAMGLRSKIETNLQRLFAGTSLPYGEGVYLR